VKEKDVEGRKDKEIGNRKTNLKWVAEERERERVLERERERNGEERKEGVFEEKRIIPFLLRFTSLSMPMSLHSPDFTRFSVECVSPAIYF
jgi:hypothetical protein